MANEIFLASVVFWIGLLVIYVILNRRLTLLTRQVAELENTRKKE